VDFLGRDELVAALDEVGQHLGHVLLVAGEEGEREGGREGGREKISPCFSEKLLKGKDGRRTRRKGGREEGRTRTKLLR